MTEHPSLETPGGLIRAARESQGVSLAEMSERTKIPPQVIEAIERDEYHKVSGALYIKSFLRTCAVEMGLEPEDILDLYGSFSGEIRPQVGGAETVWSEPEVKISRIGMPWRLISLAGVGLILVGAAVLLLVRGCGSESDQEQSEPTVVAQQIVTLPDDDQLLVDEGDVDGNEPESAGERESGETIDPAAAATTVQKSDRPDTLARAWTNGSDKKTPVVKPETVATPVETAAERRAPATQSSMAMPMPLVGGSHLVFAGGQKKRVVLRVICDRPLAVEVKQDAGQTFVPASWPGAGTAVVPLPPTGIVSGQVYGIAGGYVVYWGANDHFSLRLDRTDGVEVALNGVIRNIQNLRPGGELLLDAHGN